MSKATSPSGSAGSPPEINNSPDHRIHRESIGFGEDNASSTLTRATKNWRKIKEISEKGEKEKEKEKEKEDNRPPWRIVSLSTLPKADKNAILRAKLLDASRRMRLGKIPVAVQTDTIPTKLMKEVNTDIQHDLIGKRDVEILTDGAITLNKEGPGEFFLTHSVAQMTDVILAAEAQTQTVTPRTSNRFFEEYFNKNHPQTTVEDDEVEEILSKNEKKLLNQLKEIHQIDEQLKNKGKPLNEVNESNLSDDSLVDDENEESPDEVLPQRTRFMRKKSYSSLRSLLKPTPTMSAWHFQTSDDEGASTQGCQKRCLTEANRPWSSFNDIVIDSKLANMKLVPVPAKKCALKKKSIIWSDTQHNAVADLVNEANALLAVFEEMSILLGPDIELNSLPEKDNIEIKFLSDYWVPILRESDFILERKMAALKQIPAKKIGAPQPGHDRGDNPVNDYF